MPGPNRSLTGSLPSTPKGQTTRSCWWRAMWERRHERPPARLEGPIYTDPARLPGGGGGANLHRAYELGRRALAEGLGGLEMASLHHQALATVVGSVLALEEMRTVGKSGEYIHGEFTMTPLIKDEQVVGVLGIGRDITERKRAQEALRRLNETLEEEAKRIAHALHDEAGQLLASVHIALEGIFRDLPPSAGYRLREVKAFLDQIEVHLRQLSHELRPTILHDLGLVPALEFLSEVVSNRTKLQVTVEGSTIGRLAAPVETALYRIVQEALNNATRHAQASRTTIRLEQNGHMIRCLISDDGIGFDVPAALNRKGDKGLGLIGIRERLNAIGGAYRIISAPGQGTTLQVEIPLDAQDATQDPVSR